MEARNRRSAQRTLSSIPAEFEVVGRPLGMREDLGDPIEHVAFPAHLRGERFTGTILDLSVNGARLTSSVFPHVLSRVALTFHLPRLGRVEGIGLVMWRRSVPHELEREGQTVLREAGFGLVFESLALEARMEIARLVEEQQPSVTP